MRSEKVLYQSISKPVTLSKTTQCQSQVEPGGLSMQIEVRGSTGRVENFRNLFLSAGKFICL